MTCFYYSAVLDVPAEQAWKVIEAYARSAVHVFSSCAAERQEGDYRIVTRHDGVDVYELVLSTDPKNMRHAYTVPKLGADYHFATMQIQQGDDGKAVFVWTTDFYPHDALGDTDLFKWDDLFAELVTALNTQKV